MLSGVGPADHLREVGVGAVLDLPGVGRNLQDHPLVFRVLQAAGDLFSLHEDLRLDRLALHGPQWALSGKGPSRTIRCRCRASSTSRPGSRPPTPSSRSARCR